MASWVVWGVLAIVAVLLGLVGTFFSVRTLRWFSVITAVAAVIAITRYGYAIADPPSSNLANAFTSGADAVINALLHIFWLGQSAPTPGPVGRWVVLVLILLGYRTLEAWAMRRQPPQLDTSGVGDGQPGTQPDGKADGGDSAEDKQRKRLMDELKFRLSAMEIRAPSILPGGSRTNELASIAEASGNSAGGLAGAIIRFAGMIWPNPRRIHLKVRVEATTRVTVELENARTGNTLSTKTVAASADDEIAAMVAGCVARQIFAMDRTTPHWCYGAIDGSDLGAWLMARLERIPAGSLEVVQEARQKQIERMWQAADNGRAAGVVRYELAQLLDLYAKDVDTLKLHALRLNSLRLHAMNRAQYHRFYRGRYRLAMSLEMICNPEHPAFSAEDTKTTLEDTFKILCQAGVIKKKLTDADVGEPDRDGRCTLSAPMRKELLTIAALELHDIRRQLALWRVVRDTLLHRDERAIWLPHWRPRHRQAFRDGVCVAELLVAIRLKLLEPELTEAERRPDARLTYLASLSYLKPGLDITSAIAGDTGLLRWHLAGPHGGNQARPAAGDPGAKVAAARDKVRWLPRQCRTASWQAAYNTACLYATVADKDCDVGARVVVALERAINNPDSEMERAYDWIFRDPDFAALQDQPDFKAFRETQGRRDYPKPFSEHKSQQPQEESQQHQEGVPQQRQQDMAPTALGTGQGPA